MEDNLKDARQRLDEACKKTLDKVMAARAQSEKIMFEEIEAAGLAREGAAILVHYRDHDFVAVQATDPAEQSAFDDALSRGIERVVKAGLPIRFCAPSMIDTLAAAQRMADEERIRSSDAWQRNFGRFGGAF